MQTTSIHNKQGRSCYKVKSCTKPVGLHPYITVTTKYVRTDQSNKIWTDYSSQLFLLYLFQQDYCAYYNKQSKIITVITTLRTVGLS